MRKILMFVTLMIISMSNLMAYSKEEIAKSLKKQAEVHNIDKRVLYTIAKMESNFKPYVIAFVSSDKEITMPNVLKKVTKYGNNKYLIQMKGTKENLIATTNELISMGYLVDVGLMQINSQNFDESEVERMFEIDYNISKAVKVLKFCGKKKQVVSKTIECYNKGLKFNSLSYYDRFKAHFLKDFGVKL